MTLTKEAKQTKNNLIKRLKACKEDYQVWDFLLAVTRAMAEISEENKQEEKE